ncbi:MAG: tRNA (N6-threonylcarbamoyladenosine(37)-N6)-methyltransferase TrmO [Prevotella sp.]|nr:tRNA (N6-threonylcarbamoyladenosine(37)-N6)-methyltransferase TrmO [Prevotella sp.]
MNIEPIAYFHSPFTSKFGVPRQSGLIEDLQGTIVFTKEYSQPEALRGLEAYDYLWMIWGFSENETAEKHATVRPPLLGGNERIGVWATRSPFRPNNLGLSSVRILAVHPESPSIEVLGADLMDGTPIYDVKPYLPYVDCHAEARGGFTDHHPWQRLQVVIPTSFRPHYSDLQWRIIEESLSLDPRPHYHSDPQRVYVMPFAEKEISFVVADGVLTIVKIV